MGQRRISKQSKVSWVVDYYGTRVLSDQTTAHLEGVLEFLRNNNAAGDRVLELRKRIRDVINSRKDMTSILKGEPVKRRPIKYVRPEEKEHG